MTQFEVLGLDAAAPLTDDDVRAAWRRIAEATHPDRADGGDLEAYVAAAAAYTALRTPTGRGEVLAELRERAGGRGGGGLVSGPEIRLARLPLRLAASLRNGRPWRLGLRLLAAAGISALAVAGAGGQPASLAVLTGAVTWLLLTIRDDLA